MRISYPPWFLKKADCPSIFWYDVKECGFPYPTWFFERNNWVSCYYWYRTRYSVRGCGFPYAPWFCDKKFEIPLYCYSVKKRMEISSPPWFFMKDLNYRYIYIAWKDADFLPSLIFWWKFELTLSWYSMKGCGFPYPPWFFKKTDCTPYLIPVWCEKKDGDFLPSLIFLWKIWITALFI